jgi:cyanocobalamin reductase (cyanide-eliminating) / alkylcobalamin dealkylase
VRYHQTVTERLIHRLGEAGFDLAQSFPARDYDAQVDAALRLPEVDHPDPLAMVVGNTGALWPRFLAARAADPVLAADPDPLDRYTEQTLAVALAGTGGVAVFGHTMPVRVAIQRAARIAGLAALAPSHLSIHPTYGPWIALRAVIVLPIPAPPPRAPATVPCDCAANCLPRLQAALAAGVPQSRAELAQDHLRWLAIRDACPIGRGHRYSAEQIAYHYGGSLAEPKP